MISDVCHYLNMTEKEFLSESKNFHEYLEEEAERALQGERTSQKRLSEAEEMDRSWERRNFDFALYENRSSA